MSAAGGFINGLISPAVAGLANPASFIVADSLGRGPYSDDGRDDQGRQHQETRLLISFT
jgi:hypothetical protein